MLLFLVTTQYKTRFRCLNVLFKMKWSPTGHSSLMPNADICYICYQATVGHFVTDTERSSMENHFQYLKDNIHPPMDDWDVLDRGEDTTQESPEESTSGEAIEDEEEGLEAALQSMIAKEDGESMAASCEAIVEPAAPVKMLEAWPLYALSQEDSDLSILRFLKREEDPSGPLGLSYFENTADLQPVDFGHLRQDVVLAVGVAMLWGYLPSVMVCHDCGGKMQLRTAQQDRYKVDSLSWYCLNKGQIKQWSHTKKKNYARL